MFIIVGITGRVGVIVCSTGIIGMIDCVGIINMGVCIIGPVVIIVGICVYCWYELVFVGMIVGFLCIIGLSRPEAVLHKIPIH